MREPIIRVNPVNTPTVRPVVLISGADFFYLTGMPKYHYTLGVELITLGYEVIITAPHIGGDIAEMARTAGIRLYTYSEILMGMIDLQPSFIIIAEPTSELIVQKFLNVPTWNYLHSALECDAPITGYPQIRGYLAPREAVAAKWSQASLEPRIVPIPIDFERFKPTDKIINLDRYVILAPGTLDALRKQMHLNLIARAKQNKKILVKIVGMNFGSITDVDIPDNVEILPQNKDMPELMAECDEVAGIFEGTVTLEAWAMDKKTSVYDEFGNYKMVDKPKDFEKYNSKKVAKQFQKIFYETWADIIIPHHNRADHLSNLLQSIPLRNYNVIIRRNGTFSYNCNEAAKLAQTDNLIFVNDDVIMSSEALWSLLDTDGDVVGIEQRYSDGEPFCLGIEINNGGQYRITLDREKALYPSGGCFKIKRWLWEKLGGFSCEFINGGEDQDLFLRALELGAKISFTKNTYVIHHLSQSEGRFKYLQNNDDVFYSKWPKSRIDKIKNR